MFLPFKISPRLCSISVKGLCAPGASLGSLTQQQFQPGGPWCGAQGEWLGSAGCISAHVRAHCSAPPPDPWAIRLPAVQGEQLDGMALTSFSVKSPSGGLSARQAW